MVFNLVMSLKYHQKVQKNCLKTYRIENRYYESGEVELRTPLIDGIKQGEAIAYYKGGEVKTKEKFIDGKGEFVCYTVNGKTTKCNWKD